MAPAADLRDWITRLERAGELVRVTAEVDPDLEITEIVDRTVKAGGPALLFERPKGSRVPLLINQFGTEKRMCMGFDVERLDDVAGKLEDVLEMQPPQGLVEKVRGLKKLKSIADSLPKTVRSGACQEVVLEGDDVDLDVLPIQRCWPGDPAPFITLPAVITKDPHSGVRNVGMYRMQKVDRRTTLMHWQLHKDGRADWLATDGRIPVAVALGLDPITCYSASAPLPKHIGELMLAGFLKGAPVELVKAKTIDLEVPAHAEIVIDEMEATRKALDRSRPGDLVVLCVDYATEVWKEIESRRSLAHPGAIRAAEGDGQVDAVGGDPDLIEFTRGDYYMYREGLTPALEKMTQALRQQPDNPYTGVVSALLLVLRNLPETESDHA